MINLILNIGGHFHCKNGFFTAYFFYFGSVRTKKIYLHDRFGETIKHRDFHITNWLSDVGTAELSPTTVMYENVSFYFILGLRSLNLGRPSVRLYFGNVAKEVCMETPGKKRK